MTPTRGLSPGLAFGLLLAGLVGLGLLASGWQSAGSTPTATPTGPPPGRSAREAPVAVPSDAAPVSTGGTAEVTLEDVREGVTLPDGPFVLEAGEDELGQAVADGLEQSGTRITDLEISLGESGTMMFAGRLADQNLPIAGVIDLRVVDGRLDPEVTEATLGGVALPGFARGYVDDLVGEATSFGDILADQGVVLDQISTGDGRLSVTGRSG
ncbi:MAG: hypothetical protein ACR2MA_04240 [Egibacteraceae bacterium]